MYHKVILLLVCIWVSISVMGQDKYSCPEATNVSISSDKPNVYLVYGRTAQEKEQIFHYLRLQNISRWAIKINAVPGITPEKNTVDTKALCTGKRQVLVNETEVKINYTVVAQSRNATPRSPIFINSQVHWEIWLAPGDALIYKVPSQDLNEDYSIKVSFSYEWEKITVPFPKGDDAEAVLKYYEKLLKYEAPEHAVYFRYFKIKEQ